jgi:hypothetical protein
MIVGICGRKRSGKDSAANLLVEKHGFQKLAFADPLKKLAAQFLGFPSGLTQEDAFKVLKVFLEHSQSGMGMIIKPVTGRDVLQRLGQSCREIFGPQFWVEQTMKQIGDRRICGDCGVGREEHGLWRAGQIYGCERFIERIYSTGAPVLDKRDYVISDVRYWSELRAVKNAGGIIIRLNREDRQFKHDFYEDAIPHREDDPNVPRGCDYTYPDGDYCGLPYSAHPSHFSGDTHSSETELPDESPEYSVAFTCASGEEAAESIRNWVEAYKEAMR